VLGAGGLEVGVQRLLQARFLVRVDRDHRGDPVSELGQVPLGGAHHDQPAGRTEYSVELSRVARGEHVQHHVDRLVDQGEGAEDVPARRSGSRMGSGRRAQGAY
jgi:hypothetical protein